MDLLALATMKNVANCDKYCELQNSVNHRIFERILRFLVFRGACLFENRFIPHFCIVWKRTLCIKWIWSLPRHKG